MRTVRLIFKIIGKAIMAFLIIVIVCLAAYVITIKVMQKKGQLDKLPINIYVILTQSMHPTIKAGDMIVDYRNQDGLYNVGDIITFVSSDKFSNGVTITHRIVEILDSGDKIMYRTKGDSNSTADPTPTPKENVIGRVLFKIPKVGFIQQFLVTKTGWIVAIVLPCMGIIVFDIVKLFTRRPKKIKVEPERSVIIQPSLAQEDTEKTKEIIVKNENVERVEEDEDDFWGIN